MTFCFLFFGYLGVPVPFSLMAGVFVGALLSDVSLAAIIQKMFDGVDSEALLAIPFFLLVGELMSSANVVVRVANLSLAWSAISAAACRKSSLCSACSSRKCPARPPPTSRSSAALSAGR
jgi:TRAP-type mannitol/chloroaromatic compound transport system permease large subunit